MERRLALSYDLYFPVLDTKHTEYRPYVSLQLAMDQSLIKRMVVTAKRLGRNPTMLCITSRRSQQRTITMRSWYLMHQSKEAKKNDEYPISPLDVMVNVSSHWIGTGL